MIHNPILYNNTDWVRPTDWLPIDHLVTDTDEKIAILFGVFDDEMNKVCFFVRVGTVINWGDGNITTGTIYGDHEHTYNYSDIPDNTLCSRGYKQVVITIYPKPNTAYHLTRLYCSKPVGMFAGSSPRILDMRIRAPYIDSFRTGGSGYQRWSMMERFVWVGPHNLSINYVYFYFCVRLQYLYWEYPKISYFYSCYLLPINNMIYSSDDYCLTKFYNNYKIKEYINTNSLTTTSIQDMFVSCFSLEKVEMNIPNVINMNASFIYCYNLREVVLYNCGNISSTALYSNAFAKTCTGLVKLELHGLVVSIDCDTMSLSTTALNNLFTSLGTPSTTQTIYIRNNPGSSTCDTSIATNKNWIVIKI